MKLTSLSMCNLCIAVTTLLFLTACGGGGGGSIVIPVTPTPNPTTPPPAPTVDISGPGNIAEKTPVTLTGSSSFTGNVTYTWTQTGGTPVQPIANGNTITFTSPGVIGVNVSEYMEFTLVATKDGVSTDPIWFTLYVESQNTFEDNAEYFTTAVFSAKESYLQIAEVVRQAVNRIAQPDTAARAVCYNGGEETTTHTDTDGNGVISATDIIRITFNDCSSQILDTYAFGYLDVTVTEASLANKTLNAVISLDNFSVSDEFDRDTIITSQGELELQLSETNTTRNYAMSNSQPVIFSVLNVPFIRIDSSNFSKTQNLTQAKYTLELNAQITEVLTQSTFNVTTNTPLSGFLGEYPNQGELSIGQSGGESFIVQPNNIIDSDMLKLIVDSQTLRTRWSEYVEGTLFGFDNANRYTNEYRIDNFVNFGQLDSFLQFSNIEAPVLKLLMSRPIDRVDISSLTFRLDGFPYTTVPTEVTTDGALLTVTPLIPLKAGMTYSIYGIDVFSEFGQAANMSFLDITTSDAVIPNISATSRAYRQDDYPTLDASASKLNAGSNLTILWTEVSNVGVVFADASAAITAISLPNNVNDSVTEDIKIRLTVSNESGRTAQEDITLSYQPTPASYISLVSEQGDYIGQSALWFENQATAFSSESTLTNPNQIVLNYNGSTTWWSMHLESADAAPLAVGQYSAQRWPFQSEGFAGFDFSGDGRGCNQLTADFEIIELAYNDAGELSQLSVDFTQYCEQPNGPALNGQVRFNSSMRINP
ncbi:MAG: hypothetical protein ABF267_09335 [Glaciecola sp.]|jgi:hypothetical protein